MPGRQALIGAAGEVTDGLGQVFLVAVRPSSDLSAASAFALEDENGTDQAWSLTARAVCAEHPRARSQSSPGVRNAGVGGPGLLDLVLAELRDQVVALAEVKSLDRSADEEPQERDRWTWPQRNGFVPIDCI